MENKNLNKLGIDIGSTTVKIAVLGKNNELLFADYERHFANIRETLTDLLKKAFDKLGQFKAGTDALPVPADLPLPNILAFRLCRRLFPYLLPYRTMRHRLTLPLSLVARMPKLFILKVVMWSSV